MKGLDAAGSRLQSRCWFSHSWQDDGVQVSLFSMVMERQGGLIWLGHVQQHISDSSDLGVWYYLSYGSDSSVLREWGYFSGVLGEEGQL
jgi:hypothetical protein